MKKTLPIIVILGLVFSLNFAFAYVMSSPNYRIQSDSLNVGGIEIQSSPQYRLRETIGEIATDEMISSSYKLKGGYRQMQEVYIGISVSPLTVTMNPAIGGLTGGQGNGLTTATVITDNPAGYSLLIKSTTTPALRAGLYYFADYTPATADIPDYTWSIPANTSEFGFTPEGSDIVQKYRDNGINCNIGTLDTIDRCWYNFSTLNENIAKSSTSNHPSGTVTTIKFRAESGPANLQVEGTYQATIIVTAIAN